MILSAHGLSTTYGATPALTRRTDWVLGLLEQHLENTHHALVEGRS